MPACSSSWLVVGIYLFLMNYPDIMADRQQNNSGNKTAGAEYPLRQLYFYLTKGCNLSCRHCWLSPALDPEGKKQPVLPLALFKQVIEEAIPLGLNGVKLTGGEPLLHPDFLAMLAFLEERELGLVLETNGLLCTAEMAREIARLKDVFVSVSVDGADAKTHDMIRGAKGAFEKSTAAIRSLAEANLEPQVIMSVMQANADQVEKVIALAEELGAGSVKFNVIQPTGRGEQLHSSANGLAVQDLILLGRKVENEFSKKTDLGLYFDYPAAFRSLGRFASGDGCGVCSILTILGILPTGEYALCGIGSQIPELVFGNISRNPLKKIWNSNPVLHELRAGLPDSLTGICGKCLMKYHCLGSCIAQNYYRSRSLWAPFWFCEQAAEKHLFPESRLNRL
jgi:SynChlorMet cassette radical SAM/SPASM protein ScmF